MSEYFLPVVTANNLFLEKSYIASRTCFVSIICGALILSLSGLYPAPISTLLLPWPTLDNCRTQQSVCCEKLFTLIFQAFFHYFFPFWWKSCQCFLCLEYSLCILRTPHFTLIMTHSLSELLFSLRYDPIICPVF